MSNCAEPVDGNAFSNSGFIYFGALSAFPLYAQNIRLRICTQPPFLLPLKAPLLGNRVCDEHSPG